MDKSLNLLEKMHRISGALDMANKILKVSHECKSLFELRMKIYDLTSELFIDKNENDENES